MYTSRSRRCCLRLLRKARFVALPVLMTGCDPGISIRQIKSPGQATVGKFATENQVVLDVKPTRQLIGEAWYDPEVRITNSSSLPITIENIELATADKTYANTPVRSETLPPKIQPRNTETIHVFFRLDGAVYKVIKRPAELRVHYESGGTHEIARVSVVGGSWQEAH